ncbi:MAG: tRNA guanosine(34) transglycosylase Tgt [Candidatus Adiutrix sp.]|jgi:queuine tRNA-ribosyltransferase|nr:tRNA guanosine(34) transglycosylase Tgt [Candidatus Adiutrix sp.]
MNRSFKFHVEARDSGSLARAGLLTTAHGLIPTPVFMPVGTRGTVKAVAPDDLERLGARIILGNTYHLMLRPGADLVARLGGLHKFMAWPGPILTDSGGYQVFSLSKLRKMNEEGVDFRSSYDGLKVFLSPERSIEIQSALGVDIMMCLDECTGYPASRAEAEKSMELTHRWARRCRESWRAGEGDRVLFGISQGGFYPDLRKRSAEAIAELDFPGQAVGGLALGEPMEERLSALEAAREAIDPEKPMYLMGLGFPEDIIEGLRRGADMFDCVIPTRNGRNGQFFTRRGRLAIRNARYREDPRPVDGECGCYTCRSFSRAYLRHLFQNGEPLAMRLASLHNLRYYLDLLGGAREALLKGTFSGYYTEFYENLRRGREEGRDQGTLNRRRVT